MKKVLCFCLLPAFALYGCSPTDTPVVAAPPADGTAVAIVDPNAVPPPPGTVVVAPQTQAAQQITSSDPSVSGIICPPTLIRGGTETLRSYEKGSAGSEADLKYQANISSLSRECSILGLEVGMKVNVTGRVILGPKGKPGSFKLPVRIAVTRGEAKPLWSKVIAVDAKVPPGSASANFTLSAEDILIPREPTDTFANVQIFAGFDPEKK